MLFFFSAFQFGGPSKKPGGGGLKKTGGVSAKPKKAAEIKEEMNEQELSVWLLTPLFSPDWPVARGCVIWQAVFS